jgi:hypothetical protein
MWKENIARRTTRRVKPMSAMLIEKYLRQQQEGVYIRQRKRPRLLGYRFGPINPASRGRGQLQHPEYARPHGEGLWREEMGTHAIDRPRGDMQQASHMWKPTEWGSEVMIGIVPCRLLYEVHVDGRRMMATMSAREGVDAVAPDNGAQKHTRINEVTGQEIIGPGYSTLGSAFQRPIGGGA